MAEPKTYDELERLAGSGRLLGAPCCHRGSASSSWAALKERAAASVFEGRTPHRSSCRRHAEEERRPSTEIRPGVYLPLIAYEPSPAFLPQPAFVGERDPPTEDWMEKYKPHPRLTRGSFTDKGVTKPHFAVLSHLTYSIENPLGYFPNSFSRHWRENSPGSTSFSSHGGRSWSDGQLV